MKKILYALIFVFIFSAAFALYSCGAKEDEKAATDDEGADATTLEPTDPPATDPPPTTDPGPKKRIRSIEFADSSDESERNPVKVGEGGGYQTIGAKFTAEFTITDMEISCPSWSDDIGTMIFKLYKWDTDYATTVAGTSVFVDTDTFVDYPDNAMMEVDFGMDIEPGTYLWELSEGKDGVGVWAYRTHGEEGLEFFKNGEPFADGTAFIATVYGYVME